GDLKYYNSCNIIWPEVDMTGKDLKLGREQKGWTQEEAASRLSVSQPYLSLMEKGLRPVPERLAHKAATAFGLSATTLPVETSWESVQPKDAKTLATNLASLGYPGFAYLKSKRKKNPGEVLLSALGAKYLESRVAEALPWLLLAYPDLDWQSLVSAAKVRDLQNKLGLVTSVARRVAEKRGENEKAELLRKQESVLQRSRLFLEDTLCNDSLTQTERRWLETNRPDEAKFWRVLTDLSPEHLSYAV
ncbi:MAG TPA: helix-turn-helix transcriptional regulator, partial [Pyrinomonadaceae bacterium]|nr:helix-turn-helix transcriptional regulator [Pyrinomonadaceae bacterium]